MPELHSCAGKEEPRQIVCLRHVRFQAAVSGLRDQGEPYEHEKNKNKNPPLTPRPLPAPKHDVSILRWSSFQFQVSTSPPIDNMFLITLTPWLLWNSTPRWKISSWIKALSFERYTWEVRRISHPWYFLASCCPRSRLSCSFLFFSLLTYTHVSSEFKERREKKMWRESVLEGVASSGDLFVGSPTCRTTGSWKLYFAPLINRRDLSFAKFEYLVQRTSH